MNYNYFVDISSWFFIAFAMGTILKTSIDSILEWLNTKKGNINKKLKSAYTIHPLMKKFFTFNKVKKSEEYSKTISNFDEFETSITTPITTFLVILGISPFIIHSLIIFLPNLHVTWCYIIYLFITLSVKTLCSIPFSYYKTFNIEEKFGFNKSTKKIFITDIIKGFLFSFVLGSVFISLLNYVFINFGPIEISDVGYMTAGFVLFSFVFEYLYMEFFIKIFNKFTPLKNKRLLGKIKSLLRKYNYNPNMVYQMDASKRTTKANAFIGGIGKSNRIVLFDTLLKNYSDDEILSILGHELAHGKLHHLHIQRVIAIILQFITLSLSIFLMYNINLYHTFGFHWVTEENVVNYSLIGFILAHTFIAAFLWIIEPISSFISRKCEYAADKYSIMFTKKKTAMISSLIKLTSENCGDLFPNKHYEMWNYSHPSLINRINAIKNINFKKDKENKNEKE